jgi:hypothetical protein
MGEIYPITGKPYPVHEIFLIAVQERLDHLELEADDLLSVEGMRVTEQKLYQRLIVTKTYSTSLSIPSLSSKMLIRLLL